LTFAAAALGHHSAAATYDASRLLTLTGQVARFDFRNPHCFLHIDVDAGPYKGRRYVVEMSSAGVLANRGWRASSVKAGDRVRITVMPSRAGNAAGLCRDCDVSIDGVVTKA
jgi:hypothetical protein